MKAIFSSTRFITLFLALAAVAHGGSFPDATLIPEGACIQLKGPDCQPADLDRIKAMGIKFVRLGFHWESMEKTKGVYDFSAKDAVVKDIRDRGLRILGCIAFGNKLYPPVYETGDGPQSYARFAAALAAHYKDANIIWEIWNEPNTMTFWGKHGIRHGNSEPYATEYVTLVNATVPAMRAADPGCTIVAGSTSCLWSESYAWMDFCFAKGILKSGIDGWSVHPYSVIRPEDYPTDYDLIRDKFVKYGAPRDFPILNTERGFPTTKAEGYAGGDPALVVQYQAWHLVRQYLMDVYGGAKLSSWYEWKGPGFGIYNGDTPNPAYHAYETLIAQLNGYRLDKRVPTKNPLDYVLAFNGPGGAVKLVAWTTPEPESDPLVKPVKTNSGPDKAVPHAIDLPVGTTGALELVQLDGTKGTVDVKNGAVTLNLTGAPQYLTVQGSK